MAVINFHVVEKKSQDESLPMGNILDWLTDYFPTPAEGLQARGIS